MKLVRRVILVAVVVCALAASSVALAAGGVAGTYKTTIRDSGHLNGKWTLGFTPSGTYTVSMNGEPLAQGRYSATAATITFSHEIDSGCTGRGVYTWKQAGKTVSFTRKRESASCNARAAVLGYRFTRVR
jgi:hypothetical protein